MQNRLSSSGNRVLHSWKEISSYTGRGVRTIQRYEARYGFPVRRPGGSPRSSVLAFTEEIDRWLAKSPTREPEKAQESVAVPTTALQEIRSAEKRVLEGFERIEAMQRHLEQVQALLLDAALGLKQTTDESKALTRLQVARLAEPEEAARREA